MTLAVSGATYKSMSPAAATDLTASTAPAFAAALKVQLDRALDPYDQQFGGFRPEISLVGDGKVPTLFVRVRPIATKDTMINAAGVKARQVCAKHTYEGKAIMVECVAGESRPRYF